MTRETLSPPVGAWIMAVGSAAGLIVALIGDLAPGSPIGHTGGALLVVASSACLLVASLLEMITWVRQHWTGPTLTVLIILGIIGTTAAAYFLESMLLEAAMALTFVGWLAHLFWHPGPRETAMLEEDDVTLREPAPMRRRELHEVNS